MIEFDDPNALYTRPTSQTKDAADANAYADEIAEICDGVDNRLVVAGIDEMNYEIKHSLGPGVPKVSDWKEADGLTTITVDRAREIACNQAQREIDHIKKVSDLTGKDNPKIEDIADLVCFAEVCFAEAHKEGWQDYMKKNK